MPDEGIVRSQCGICSVGGSKVKFSSWTQNHCRTEKALHNQWSVCRSDWNLCEFERRKVEKKVWGRREMWKIWPSKARKRSTDINTPEWRDIWSDGWWIKLIKLKEVFLIEKAEKKWRKIASLGLMMDYSPSRCWSDFDSISTYSNEVSVRVDSFLFLALFPWLSSFCV